MSSLFDMPLVLATAAFLAGYVLAKLGGLIGRRERRVRRNPIVTAASAPWRPTCA